jgi:cobalt-precorrin 5A hydrolase
MIVAGLGCRRGCTAADLVAAVRLAERSAGVAAAALAAPRFKAHEGGLHAAAAALGLPLLLVEEEGMRAVQPRCPTRSDVALAATGLASVAEGAALAVSGGKLVLPRVAVGGATCALAGALFPLPSGEGWGEGVFAAERGTGGAVGPRGCVGGGGASGPPHPNPLPEGEGEA